MRESARARERGSERVRVRRGCAHAIAFGRILYASMLDDARSLQRLTGTWCETGHAVTIHETASGDGLFQVQVQLSWSWANGRELVRKVQLATVSHREGRGHAWQSSDVAKWVDMAEVYTTNRGGAGPNRLRPPNVVLSSFYQRNIEIRARGRVPPVCI